MAGRWKYLSKPIWLLSLVSLLTDMAGEMLYPIMPVYLQGIGFSVALIGLLEGLAEMTAGLSKGYFGHLSDTRARRLPFVRTGYILSAISKPLLAISTLPWWVFIARTTDRFGKGVRTASRDALLSGYAAPGTKGRVFGFHRSLDTLGAVIGPLLALLFLKWRPADYTSLFLIAFVPGALSILLLYVLKEPQYQAPATRKNPRPWAFIQYWKRSPQPYRRLVIGLGLFALFNSSDVLLLLKMKESGLSDSLVISTYIFYNLIFAFFSFPAGWLADKWGLKRIFLTGICFYVLVYAGFSVATTTYQFIGLWVLYGLYAACTEGVAKAWLADMVPSGESATALGFYASLQSVAALFASSLAGVIWWQFGAFWAFLATSLAACIAGIYLFLLKESGNIAVSKAS